MEEGFLGILGMVTKATLVQENQECSREEKEAGLIKVKATRLSSSLSRTRIDRETRKEIFVLKGSAVMGYFRLRVG